MNYSTTELGLGLGVSIKTINYKDGKSNRYTKNYSRNDNELRAESMDYHQRQPYSVLVGLLFLPGDACDDAYLDKERSESSFAAAIRYFRMRAGRRHPIDAPDLFERFFIGLYEHEGASRGAVVFYDVERPKPQKKGRPKPGEILSLDEVLVEIRSSYDARNNPPFEYAD